jgi:copper homeostasis protein CutC
MKRLLEGTQKKQLGEKDFRFAKAMGFIDAAIGELDTEGGLDQARIEELIEVMIKMSNTAKGLPKDMRDEMYDVQMRIAKKARALK